MSLKPIGWNVVVIGHWNCAILSPAGIAKRLFGLEEGKQVEVYISLDAMAPPRIRHERVEVIAASDRLIVRPIEPRFELLVYAMSVARKAVSDLPETPLLAAGVNVRYDVEDPPESLLAMITHESDTRLSDKSYKIVSRSQSRKIEWNDGKINIGQINISVNGQFDGSCQILFNFDNQSLDAKVLGAWLETSSKNIESTTNALLKEYIGIDLEEQEQ